MSSLACLHPPATLSDECVQRPQGKYFRKSEENPWVAEGNLGGKYRCPALRIWYLLGHSRVKDRTTQISNQMWYRFFFFSGSSLWENSIAHLHPNQHTQRWMLSWEEKGSTRHTGLTPTSEPYSSALTFKGRVSRGRVAARGWLPPATTETGLSSFARWTKGMI